MTDDFTPKTPECWKCGTWGSGVESYRLTPTAKLRWKCEDEVACDKRMKANLLKTGLR